MKESDVRARLDLIRLYGSDNEAAHAEEDDLYVDVLSYYARKGSKIAKLALEARDIPFTRWYA